MQGRLSEQTCAICARPSFNLRDFGRDHSVGKLQLLFIQDFKGNLLFVN